MKTYLLKITILIVCLAGLISPNVKAITITAYGFFNISDINHPSATYTVYAYVEFNGNYYPCSSNPFTTSATVGTNYVSSLTFYNVPVPNPPFDVPYRILLVADRNPNPPFWSGQTQVGYSDWGESYSFNPWSPSSIRIYPFS